MDDCYFVDLPGYGYAKVSNADRERWDDLINSYFEADRNLTVLVQLLAKTPMGMVGACFVVQFFTDYIDRVICLFVVSALTKALPRNMMERL